MAFRSVRISKPTHLAIRQKRLVIRQQEEFEVPLEDITTITLEGHELSLTATVLQRAAEEGIVVIVCDDKHLPSGVFLPLNRHSRQLSVINMQLSLSKPFMKRCWQKIIQSKIMNQALCCEYMGLYNEAKMLEELMKEVFSGDATNRESVAAQSYFLAVFDVAFRRRNERDWRNSALNYGYAVLRAAIARTLVEYGFIVSMGIHHHSELNAFNLADDFIEPFRPVVDLYVSKLSRQFSPEDSDLLPAHKSELTGLLHCTIEFQGEECSVMHAIDLCVKSYVTACRVEKYELLQLPVLIPLRRHTYE
jgi:CRISPR-associated protein Cas1